MNFLEADYSCTSYWVQGFRSLIDFSITLRPGLNVLVGPNGSGKTNYIDFLDFLSSLVRGGAAHAVSNAGGVARVFSQENLRRKTPKLSCRIGGVANTSEIPLAEDGPLRYFQFDYEVELKFDKANSSVYVSKEGLKLGKLFQEGSVKHSSHLAALTVERSVSTEEVAPKLHISPRLLTKNRRNPFSLRRRYQREVDVKDRLESSLFDGTGSFLNARSAFPALDAVRNVITRGNAFNIAPDRVRTPDDIASLPFIAKDGTGVSAVLHHLQKLRDSATDAPRRAHMRHADRTTFDEVTQWIKLVLPSVTDISIKQDFLSGKLIGEFVTDSGPNSKIRFQDASDGSLKWLCLVTLLTSFKAVYTLEEPENYLHPKMQQYLVALIREALIDAPSGMYFICSTHSESLINECQPEELIVFNAANASTRCHRLKSPSAVKREINKTGFGLGHYYAQNVLS